MRHLALRLRPVLALFMVFGLACAPIQPTFTPEQEVFLATADSTQINVDSVRVVFEADAVERAKKKERVRTWRVVGGVVGMGLVVAAALTFASATESLECCR